MLDCAIVAEARGFRAKLMPIDMTVDYSNVQLKGSYESTDVHASGSSMIDIYNLDKTAAFARDLPIHTAQPGGDTRQFANKLHDESWSLTILDLANLQIQNTQRMDGLVEGDPRKDGHEFGTHVSCRTMTRDEWGSPRSWIIRRNECPSWPIWSKC